MGFIFIFLSSLFFFHPNYVKWLFLFNFFFSIFSFLKIYWTKQWVKERIYLYWNYYNNKLEKSIKNIIKYLTIYTQFIWPRIHSFQWKITFLCLKLEENHLTLENVPKWVENSFLENITVNFSNFFFFYVVCILR